MNHALPAPDWHDLAWQAEAHAWIRATLAQHGHQLTGAITQPHLRPWSTVLHAPTDAGSYYFKALLPTLSHELPLTVAITDWLPAYTLQPIAVDAERAWMLLPDGGARLREQSRADRYTAYWSRVLAAYAEGQIALAAHVPELLSLGTPDRRLAQLPQLYAHVLQAVERLDIAADVRLTPAEQQELHRLTPQVAAWCAELAAWPIPESLHHGDLHDGNIFFNGEQAIFFDWGDASVTHPFMSMRTVFVSVEITLDLADGGAVGMPFVDTYLEPWARFASPSVVRKAFQGAQRLAPIVSALSWQRVVACLNAEQEREYAGAVAHLLREFLQNATASTTTERG